MDYAKQYQEYLARANQALEKACETFLPCLLYTSDAADEL